MLTDLRLPALLVATLGLAGCGAGYLTQAAVGHWTLMADREPIASVIANPDTPDPLRARLERVADMREFASRELGLPDNGSYRSYVDLERPYVVWNVVAAPEFSVAPLQWCFPVAGCVAYRGYFDEQAARDTALELRSRGYDAYASGVTAYSTLGRFADPVLSSMLEFGEDDLAALLFHELAHQLLYVPGDSAFNEAFAVTVEQAGLARWLASQGRPDEMARYEQRRARQAEIAALFAGYRAELRTLYAQPLEARAMRQRKREVLARLGADIEVWERQHELRTVWHQWLDHGLGNAHVASVATYYGCVPAFERLLANVNGDLRKFYAAVREIANGSARDRTMICGDTTPPSPPPTSPLGDSIRE